LPDQAVWKRKDNIFTSYCQAVQAIKVFLLVSVDPHVVPRYYPKVTWRCTCFKLADNHPADLLQRVVVGSMRIFTTCSSIYYIHVSYGNYMSI
jgi:hypothetical protein